MKNKTKILGGIFSILIILIISIAYIYNTPKPLKVYDDFISALDNQNFQHFMALLSDEDEKAFYELNTGFQQKIKENFYKLCEDLDYYYGNDWADKTTFYPPTSDWALWQIESNQISSVQTNTIDEKQIIMNPWEVLDDFYDQPIFSSYFLDTKEDVSPISGEDLKTFLIANDFSTFTSGRGADTQFYYMINPKSITGALLGADFNDEGIVKITIFGLDAFDNEEIRNKVEQCNSLLLLAIKQLFPEDYDELLDSINAAFDYNIGETKSFTIDNRSVTISTQWAPQSKKVSVSIELP